MHPPILYLRGQSSHEDGFLFQITITAAVIDQEQIIRQTGRNEQ